MNWYVGTDWYVIPAGGNSLRQVFVRLEDCQVVEAELTAEHLSHSCTIAEEHESRTAFQERIKALEAALAQAQARLTELSDMRPATLKQRVRELEEALQLRCPQCDMRLAERTALETPAASRPSFRGWIQSACENCGKLAAEHPQPNMWCYETDRGAAK
jgi:predicted nuclease with TOPRIM domain